MAAPTGQVRRRRTWPQRLLIGFNLTLVVLLVTAAAGLGYFYVQFDRLPRVTFTKNTLQAEEPPGEPENFLLVGSDARDFVDTPDEAKAFGTSANTGGQRSDTIMLLRVDPKAKHAWMLSFPRDLWVPIAPDGNPQRINTAFDKGPQQLIDTIKADFNVPIHHYAEVNFKGFQGLVDTVGGVTVYLATPVRDPVTGLNITDTGCVLLHGDQSLAYVRSRHFEYQENGRWVTDPTGDLGRITRQQDFIRRALREALAKDLLNPGRINGLVKTALNNVKIDDALDLRDALRLGKMFRSLAPDAVTQYQLPVANAVTAGGADVLKILPKDQPAVDEILDVFRGTVPPAPAPPTPAATSVRVLNGSGVAGQAGNVASALRVAGFSAGEPGSTTATARTVVRYADGQQEKADLVTRYLVNGADVQEYPGLTGVDVVLVTGRDFAGVLATPKPAPPPTAPDGPPPAPVPDAPPC